MPMNSDVEGVPKSIMQNLDRKIMSINSRLVNLYVANKCEL